MGEGEAAVAALPRSPRRWLLGVAVKLRQPLGGGGLACCSRRSRAWASPASKRQASRREARSSFMSVSHNLEWQGCATGFAGVRM